jgi:O-antigen/teichoic acid export membrane protein
MKRFSLFAILKHWFSDGILRRIFKNAMLMLSGRAANGILGLATLSLMAHGLGAGNFGLVILVQTYVLVITGLATFQSWQALIRYGAIALKNNDRVGFQNLIKFTALLDLAGVIIGVLVGYFAAPIVGPYVQWDAEVVEYAQIYSFLIFFTVIATPTGLLRLFDRFDLLTSQASITPLLRLVGVAIAALVFDAPIWAYLLAWFVAGVIGGLVLIILGWREVAKHGLLDGMTWSLRGVTLGHDGIVRFSLISNFHSSLQLVTGHMATFLIGFVAGPVEAGLYKVAKDIGTALTKPAELLNQSIYPEFAKLGSQGHWADFPRLILRGGALSGGAGVVLLLIALFLGEVFLTLAFGAEFAGAHTALTLLVAAATLTISGFSMDPALYAMGRPGIPLQVNGVSVFFIFLPLIYLLGKTYGATGAGLAALASSAFVFVTMAAFTTVQLKKRLD